MSEQSIWNSLRYKGFSEKATAAIMGNMMAESGLIPYRIQGDFGNGYQRSLEYTTKVDNGAISREQFAYNGPGGGGYGLCQWTYYSRKLGLYDLAKKRCVSIGDEQLGIDWFYEEVQQGEYRQTWDALRSGDSIYEMTKVMLRNQPTRQNLLSLRGRQWQIRSMIDAKAIQPSKRQHQSTTALLKAATSLSGFSGMEILEEMYSSCRQDCRIWVSIAVSLTAISETIPRWLSTS